MFRKMILKIGHLGIIMADERPFIKETVNHVGNIQDHYLNFAGKNPYDEIDDFLINYGNAV